MKHDTEWCLPNLSSVEFVFENGEGVIVEAEHFVSLDIADNSVEFSIDSCHNRKYYDDYTGWNVLFDRMVHNDITRLILTDKCFNRHDVVIEWIDDGDTNSNQDTYINEFGRLICKIIM